MFRVITSHVPAPAGVQSPLLWGTSPHLAEIFGNRVTDVRSVERTCTFRFTSAEEFVAFFRRWYGPTLKAFEALDSTGQSALARDLTELARRWNRLADAGIDAVALPSTYLETVMTVR
jgi:hypothetical protein